jgi:hypothetical protein
VKLDWEEDNRATCRGLRFLAWRVSIAGKMEGQGLVRHTRLIVISYINEGVVACVNVISVGGHILYLRLASSTTRDSVKGRSRRLCGCPL